MKFYFVFMAMLLCHCAKSQKSEPIGSTYWGFSIYYDQDYTLEQLGLQALNGDRNYTMGVGFSFTFPSLKKSCLYAPHRLFNRMFHRGMLNDSRNENAAITNSLMMGNGSFTPDSLPAAYIIRDDRPYGSITYLQTIVSGVDMERLRHYTTTFTAGVMGTKISKEVQTKIHEAYNENDTKDPRTPRGWHNQISRDGELTFAFTGEEEHLITKKHVRDQIRTSVGGIELKHSWKYSLGYYTSLNYAFNFRLGQKDPRNWAYRLNALGGSNKNTMLPFTKFSQSASYYTHNRDAQAVDYYGKKKTFEMYLFGSLRPTFILYNALLNGQFKKSVHTLSFQDMRHCILEFDGGGAFSIPFCKNNLLELRLRMSGRSPEFEFHSRLPRWHYWGGIDLVFSHF